MLLKNSISFSYWINDKKKDEHEREGIVFEEWRSKTIMPDEEPNLAF